MIMKNETEVRDNSQKDETMIAPYRVLDLTDERGLYCGALLGNLGADVIKVEKPGGDPARGIGPFYKDIPHPERSLYWLAYNNNKRGKSFAFAAPSPHFANGKMPDGPWQNSV